MKVLPLFLIAALIGCAKTKEQTKPSQKEPICEIAISAITEERYAGNRIAQHKQEQPVNLDMFLDTASITKDKIISCNYKRITDMCVVDSLELYAYGNSVFIEYGISGTLYTLSGAFPITPSGLKPNMTKDQVISILGKPEIEAENRFQYATDDSYPNSVLLYFVGDNLHTIFYADRSGDCME